MILENKDIKVEYELDEKGNIVTSTISKQKVVKKETALERLKEYIYVDQEVGITLEYDVKTDTVFKLNVKGVNIPNMAELKLLVWLVENYVESVTISNGLYVHIEDSFLNDDEVIDKELLDLFSESVIDNIKEFNKGKEEFIFNTIFHQFKGCSFDELRQLITYIKGVM